MYTYVIRQFTILTLFDKKVHLQQTATIYKVSLQERLILAKKVLWRFSPGVFNSFWQDTC